MTINLEIESHSTGDDEANFPYVRLIWCKTRDGNKVSETNDVS